MLGMYVHTHWGYRHPYAARTWTLADWQRYLGGLRALGYDGFMVWPQLDAMAAVPNASDEAFLGQLGQVIAWAHRQLGMKAIVTLGPNCIGNEQSATYEFPRRPYFVCEQRVNPRDPAAVAAFLAGRKTQLTPLREADAVAVIDSDPGGYIGTTNEDFAGLTAAQVKTFRELNPRAEFIYWLWFGWESYSRFWAEQQQPAAARAPGGEPPDDFTVALQLLGELVPEPWWLFSCLDRHQAPLDRLGLRDKALFYPYGLIEGEPTYPLTNWEPQHLAAALAPAVLARHPRGALANSQTHCMQVPHACAFAHLAQGGTLATLNLEALAAEMVPGAGAVIAAGWEAIGTADPARLRAAAVQVRAAPGPWTAQGKYAGLLFGDAERFRMDLVMTLDVRAALLDFRAAAAACEVPRSLRRLLTVLGPSQRRLGFVDAYYGPLADGLNEPLAGLHDAAVDGVLKDFSDWRSPAVRNGILPRLLAAAEDYCRRHGQ